MTQELEINMDIEEQVIKQWEKLNKLNEKEFKEFVEEYPFLSTSDFCTLLGVPKDEFSKYMLNAGLSKPTGKCNGTTFYEIPPEFYDDVDPYEDTKEWWEKHYGKFGYRKLARLANLSGPIRAKQYLEKHGIKLKGHRKTRKPHPWDNREKLHKYHVQHGFGARRLARLAGVSKWTIISWLAKHKIQRLYKKITHVAKDPSEQNTSEE